MRNSNRVIGAAAGLAILIGAIPALAQDSAQWRGTNRDGKVAGFTAPQTWPKEFVQKWKVTVGSGDATPALVGDRLYVFTRQGGDEVTLCLDAKDGNVIWQDKYATGAVTGAAARHPGPRGSPTVADGKVVTLGVNGVLSCLDAKEGKMLWRKEDIKGAPQFFTAMSPIVVDGLCIAHLGGRDNGTVAAYTLDKGEQKWTWKGEGPSYSSPALLTVDGTKMVVLMTDKSVVGLGAADGALLWQVPFAPMGRMGYNAATPIVEGTTVILAGQGRGTKALQIAKEGDKFAAKEVWSNRTGPVFNTSVLKDGLLYGLSDKGNLYCLNTAKKGETAWTGTAALKNFGAILDVGPFLLALPDSGELLVFKPSDKQYEEVAKIKVASSATYAHPVVAGKRIFVKDADSLTMWTVD